MRRFGPRWPLVALAVVLAGCGGSGGSGAATTTGVPATTAPGPASTEGVGSTSSSVARPTSTAAAPPAGSSTPTASGGSSTVTPAGFGAVSVTAGPDPLTQLCLWLAATAAERQQGLMGVTSLGAAPGMLFDFGAPSTGEFWMFQTLLPLSIAFYDEAGRFVSSTDMDPCPSATGADCPRYGAAGPYRWAVETEQGGLGVLGLVTGSRIEVGEACRPG